MRQFLILVLSILLVGQVVAQQPQPPLPLPPPFIPDTEEEETSIDRMLPPMPRQVEEPTQPLRHYDHVMYVMDVSCSMDSELLSEAVSVTSVFASDSYLATVITFDNRVIRWKGAIETCSHPENKECDKECLPSGWARLPIHGNQLHSHIENVSKGGGTTPSPALRLAIQTAPANTLIVFVSDGDFRSKWSASVVKEEMEKRESRKEAPVQILVWATTRETEVSKSLSEIAKIGGAGLWRADRRHSGPW